MRFTEKQLKERVAAGTLRGYTFMSPKPTKVLKQLLKAMEKVPVGIVFIQEQLLAAGITHIQEFRFSEDRKYRFDFAIVDKKIAIEYEGLMSKKSRHTTISGYTKDAEKYNLAQSMGWKVYRYTAKNYKDFQRDLKTMI